MKTLNQLEQEAQQARESIDNYYEVLKLFVVAANNAMVALSKICPVEGLCDTQSMESYIEDSLKAKLTRNEEKTSENYLHGDGSGKSLPEVSQEERDSDGFIKWDGGDCPVDPNLDVFVEFRHGPVTDYAHKAGSYEWRRDIVERSWDIVAYKIVKGE